MDILFGFIALALLSALSFLVETCERLRLRGTRRDGTEPSVAAAPASGKSVSNPGNANELR